MLYCLLTQPFSELWTEIASSVTIIYHVAAYVNHYLAYEDHRPANVLGTLNILRLAASGVPKVLLHVRISTWTDIALMSE